MAENIAVFFVGERITAFLVLFGKQVEKSGNVTFMDKTAVLVHTEKLAEIESHVLIDKLFQQTSEVVGVDVHGWQCRIRVGVAEVGLVPFQFGTLLHHVVPCVDFVLLEIV